jgi:hypothetical protein
MADAGDVGKTPQVVGMTAALHTSLEDEAGARSASETLEAMGAPFSDRVRASRHSWNADYAAALEVLETAARRDGEDDWRFDIFATSIQSGDCNRATSIEAVSTLKRRWMDRDPVIHSLNEWESTWIGLCMFRGGEEAAARNLLRAALGYYQPTPGRFDRWDLRLHRVAALALLGESQEALGELADYHENGFGVTGAAGVSWPIDRDVRFASLHDDPEFKRIMAAIRARNAERLKALGSGALTLESPL